LITDHTLNNKQLDSIILIDKDQIYTESTAILHIINKLTGPIRFFVLFWIIPKKSETKCTVLLQRTDIDSLGKKKVVSFLVKKYKIDLLKRKQKVGKQMNRSTFLKKLRMTIITTFRWSLALTFLIYGIAKIYPGQFSTGDFIYDSTKDSAMQLAWHFFGYSDTYNLFIAFGEITAALLLVIPKTATLGNIIYLPITVNITILDFCFEIPARSVTTLLTCMSIALLFFEYKKLKRVFFDSPVAAETSIPTNLIKKKVNIQ